MRGWDIMPVAILGSDSLTVLLRGQRNRKEQHFTFQLPGLPYFWSSESASYIFIFMCLWSWEIRGAEMGWVDKRVTEECNNRISSTSFDWVFKVSYRMRFMPLMKLSAFSFLIFTSLFLFKQNLLSFAEPQLFFSSLSFFFPLFVSWFFLLLLLVGSFFFVVFLLTLWPERQVIVMS